MRSYRTVPELTATQSSWLYTLAPLIITFELEPISKPSVLWPPPLSPALLSIVIPLMVNPLASLMLTAWTGVFSMYKLVMVDEVRS